MLFLSMAGDTLQMGLLPWDSHQTMTSISVWDTGRPNGDQRHPLVPVGPVVRGTAATCLNVAVTCHHYGPHTMIANEPQCTSRWSAFKSSWVTLKLVGLVDVHNFRQITGVKLNHLPSLSCHFRYSLPPWSLFPAPLGAYSLPPLEPIGPCPLGAYWTLPPRSLLDPAPLGGSLITKRE